MNLFLDDPPFNHFPPFEQKKIIKLINDNNKELIKSIVRDSKFTYKGYRDPTKIPIHLFINKLIEFIEKNPQIQEKIFLNWFKIKLNVYNQVTDAIKKRNIDTTPFEKISIREYIEQLSKTGHVFSVDQGNDNSLVYFAPNGNLIEGIDKFDSTLMFYLITNSDFPEKESEFIEKNKTIGMPSILHNNNKEDEYIDIPIIVETKPEKELKGIDFDEEFKILKEKEIIFNQSRKEILDQLNHASINISNNIFDITTPNNKLIDKTAAEFSTLISYQVKIVNNLQTFCNNSEIEFKSFDTIQLDKVDIDYLITEYIKLKNDLLKIINESILTFESSMKDLDPSDEEIFGLYLNEFKDFANSFDIVLYDEKLKKVKMFINQIELIKANYKLTSYCEDYLKNNNFTPLRKITNHILKHGNDFDFFFFFYALSKDINTLSNININEYFTYYESNLLKSLMVIINHSEFTNIKSLAEDPELFTIFLSSDTSKKFLVLINLILFYSGYQDIPKTNFWNLIDSVDEKSELYKLIELILTGKDFNFVNDDTKLNNLSKDIEHYFLKKNDTYEYALKQTNNVLKRIYADWLLPYFELKYNEILNMEDNDDIVLKNLEEIESEKLYKSFSKHFTFQSSQEKDIHPNCLLLISELISKLKKFLNLKSEIPDKFNKVNIDILKENISSLSTNDCDFSILSNNLFMQINEEKTLQKNTDIESILIKSVLNSNYYSIYFPKFCCDISNNNTDSYNYLSILLASAVDEINPETEYLNYLEQNNFKNAQILQIEYKLDVSKYNEKYDSFIKNFKNIENRLIEYEFIINPDANDYFQNERYGLAFKVLEEENKKYEEELEINVMKKDDLFKNILIQCSQLRNFVYENNNTFSINEQSSLLEALSKTENVAINKTERKITLAKEIMGECMDILDGSYTFDHLRILLDKFDTFDESNASESFISIPLEKIKEYVEKNDYQSLGLDRSSWNDISNERRDYIISFIENWIFLKDKPVTYEDIYKSKDPSPQVIEDSIKDLFKSFASICNLYVTDDNNNIGHDPFDTWRSHQRIPYVFITKLIQPNCEALNQVIRLFIIPNHNLNSSYYFNEIKNYINSSNLQINSSNILLSIGNSNEVKKYNTNNITKDFPIIDENVIKQIIFSVSSKKLPKWVLTKLLIKNKNISEINPFKTNGSINSENNIFVGRDIIISKLVTTPRDYAFYGGRRIGKTSLLNEIKSKLKEKGYITIMESLMGVDDYFSVCKDILSELKNEFNSDKDIEIKDYDEFKLKLKEFHRDYPDKRVAIFIDEVDEYILKENEESESGFALIKRFRDISNEINHKWIFIFAGFRELYKQINGLSYSLDPSRNPWINFVESTSYHLSGIDNPIQLVNGGLRNILSLEYEISIAKKIVNYSSGHPAFIQKFCQCLVDYLSTKISYDNRRVDPDDVEYIFDKTDEYIKFVYKTLDMNLLQIQSLIIFLLANNKLSKSFSKNEINKVLNEALEIYGIEKNIEPNKIDLDTNLDLLLITGIIEKISDNSYAFSHPYYIDILNRIVNDKPKIIDDLIQKIFI